MNRYLAHALGTAALGALLLQPVNALAEPPAHARHESTAKHRGDWSHGQPDVDPWYNSDRDDYRDRDRYHERDDHYRDRYSEQGDRYRDHDRDDYRDPDRRGDYRRGWDSHGYPPWRGGHVVHHLPPRHHVVHHHGQRYYYGHGTWYRSFGPRYIVVDPPVGLVVSFLPQFGSTVYFGGVPYYRAGAVYYVWHPRARGYVVTDGPSRRW